MKEIEGKYSRAMIYTDVVDEKSIEQVPLLCDQPFTEGARIRMIPDIHAGAGCTIGTMMTITDKIVPNLVGVDIGCGMYAILLEETSIDYAKLDDTIRAFVPFGREVRPENHAYVKEIPLKELRCLRMVNDTRAERSAGVTIL